MAWYYIAAIAVAIITIIVYIIVRRRRTLPTPDAPKLMSISSAPGVNPSTGNPPPAPVPSPVESTPVMTAPTTNRARTAMKFLSPTAALEHVPIIGGGLAAITKAPAAVVATATNKINDATTAALKHVPIAGSALAATNSAVASSIKGVLGLFS